jgi:hypothetical protein
MKKKPRLKKKYRLKARIILIVAVLLSITFVPKSHRKAIKLYFSDGCVDRYQQIYSNKLNDRIVDYIDQSRTSGIEPCDNQNDITTLFVTGELSKIRAGRRYLFGDMESSYPYLTRDSKKLLNEISRRFRKNLREDNLWRTKFIITSMTRTTENVKNLSASNINVSENSPHMYGNAFDISYSSFKIGKLHITECDKWYLKEALAEVISELRDEKRCWATYERSQGCYHVVCR